MIRQGDLAMVPTPSPPGKNRGAPDCPRRALYPSGPKVIQNAKIGPHTTKIAAV